MKKLGFISIIAAIAIAAAACEKQSFEPKLERGEIEITRADLVDTYWHCGVVMSEAYDAEGNMTQAGGYCDFVDRLQTVYSYFHITETEVWKMQHYISTMNGDPEYITNVTKYPAFAYDTDGVLSYCPVVINPAEYVPNSGRITLMNKDRIVIYVETPELVDNVEGAVYLYDKYVLTRVYPDEDFFETFAEWYD